MELKTTTWDAGDPAGVATITLSRPERRNSWTGRMHTELRHLLQRAEDDPSIRVVVITGDPAGKTFCPGADSRALETHLERGGYDAGTPPDLATPGHGVDPAFDADFAFFFGLEVVTIAAVNGAAAGVGLALACWCDLRVATSGATWTTAHGKLNLPAEYGLSWLLPRMIGHGRAADLLLTSRRFSSDEAHQMGLVTELVTGDCLAPALALGGRLVADVSPHSLRATKRQLAVDATHDDPGRSVRDAQARLDHMTTEPDYGEAMAAFLERRPPTWQG
ncbi:MAG: enoyl-CoA hydratase-related protein [Acidimicrobiales bacterium]